MAVPLKVAAKLFARPVESQTGFGVALHHLSVEAEKTGWRIVLESNEDGKVVFALLPGSGEGEDSGEGL